MTTSGRGPSYRHDHTGRRRLLKSSLAVAAAALAYRAGAQTPAARAQVVVVGGGWGGLGAVRALARQPGVEVTLVEANDRFMSCPLSAHYIVGDKPPEQLVFAYDRVDALGIRRVRDRAQAIERDKREVVLASGQRLRYDFLILAPGVEYVEESLPGFAAARESLPVGFRMFEQQAVKTQVDRFLSEGGTFLITVPRPPYRCPPAPYERAMLIAEQMKRRGTKGKIIIADANPNPTPPPIAGPITRAMQSLYPNEIEYRREVTPTGIDVGRKVLGTSAGEIAYDFINPVLPMRAPALVRAAGLGERWADVQLPSFQARVDERVFVIGDAQGSPQPKSGHVAFGQGQRVGQLLLDRVAGKAAAAPSGAIELPAGICWANATLKTAININVVTMFEPGQAPQLRFTVDPEHNERSGDGALQWGRTLWSAMLG